MIYFHINKIGDDMKKGLFFFLILVLLSPVSATAIGDSATSSILMDTDSKRILYSKNAHEVRSVASISKIMTAIVAIESNKLEKTVTIDESVLKAYGSGIYVKVGEKLTLKDLLYGLMLRSGNDAALAIADYVSGSKEKFVDLMNKKAQELGMKNSVFNNPSGLDEDSEKGNFSTAYDMAILTSYAVQNKIYREIVGTKKYVLKTNKNTYVWHNKNKLLSNYQYTTGGKTGFTKKARRTLVSTATKDNLNLVVVTLNDGNDFQDHANLHDYGFKNYKNYTLLKKGIIKIEKDNYYKNDELYLKNNLSLALLNEEKENVNLDYKLTKTRKVKDGEVVGTVKVMLDDKVLAEEDIYFKEKNVLKKKKNSLVDWIRNLW